MWFVLGFGTACGLCAYTWHLDHLLLPTAACVLLFAILTAAGRRYKTLRRFAVIALGCAAGFGWFHLYSSLYLQDSAKLDGAVQQAEIICTDYSVPSDYGSYAEGYITVDGKPYRVRVSLKEDLQIAPGDELRGTFSFYTTTPGGERPSVYRQSEGIFLTAYARDVEKHSGSGKTPFWAYPAIWRETLKNLLERSFPEDTVSFAKAILLGDRSGISYETSTAFKLSGISHIIAVSGMHVAILSALLCRFCFNRRYLILLAGTPILILFAAITGFSPSITRAVIMQILMMLGMALDREYDGITALSFAAFAMLLVNPLVISSVSFQLSVGCMLGIFLFEEPLSHWMTRQLKAKGKGIPAKCKRWIGRTISVTLASMSLTTPLVAYYFGAVSLVSVVTNLLVLWVMGAVFYGALLVCIAGWVFPGACGVIAWVVSWPIRYILWIAKLLASFPLAAVYVQSIYIVAWLILCYALLAVFCLDHLRKPLLLLSCMVISLCAALCLSWLEPMRWEYSVTVLDVGQGQSILLQSEGRTFLVDCGGSSDTKSADIAAETLLAGGTDHLDGIILTHFDRDHAGGIFNLLTRISADWILVPKCRDGEVTLQQLESYMPGKVTVVSETSEISYDNTVMTVFPPVLERSGNENSLCILFQGEKYGTLITGDREHLGESVLLKQTDLPEVDILIAGHHGAEDSTTQQLLDAVRPEYVFISVGENRYGHPHDALLARLKNNGCIIYRTDQNGDIVFRR